MMKPQELICPQCGRSLKADARCEYGICPSCGVTLPLWDGRMDETGRMWRMAQKCLQDGEFADAEVFLRTLLERYPRAIRVHADLLRAITADWSTTSRLTSARCAEAEWLCERMERLATAQNRAVYAASQTAWNLFQYLMDHAPETEMNLG